MTYAAFTSGDMAYGRLTRRSHASSQAVVCAFALILGTPIGAWWLYARTGEPTVVVSVASPDVLPKPRRIAAPLSSPARVALLDPAFVSGYEPGSFSRPMMRSSDFTPLPDIPPPARRSDTPVVVEIPAEPSVADVPLPLARPHFDAATAMPAERRVARLRANPTLGPSSAPSGFFARMFGAPETAPALAYANPGEGGVSTILARQVASTDERTAVYDIASHTVILPGGARLEAHSGLGESHDNPNSVTEHMRGATPPAIYDLTLREGLFHGVQALRLTPLDANATHGRMGLLAHSYMLGPSGASNGCVVFRNYAAFLHAYESGSVRRLVVIGGTS